jgi:hypothetical protein
MCFVVLLVGCGFSSKSVSVSEKFLIQDVKPLVATLKKKAQYIPHLIITLIVGCVINTIDICFFLQ